MKVIELTQNKYAIVDDEDFEYLSQWKWHFRPDGYAGGHDKGKTILMHRLVNNTPKGLPTDHINRNKLDNRKENLHTVSFRENNLNRNKQKNNTSGITGVRWHKRDKKWIAQTKVNGKYIYLGSFKTFIEASLTRREAEGRV